MKTWGRWLAVVATSLVGGMLGAAGAQSQDDAAQLKVGPQDIGGVISSPHGREAGVWVIAETKELPTRFARIVVSDEEGRYLIPNLPRADYSIWARG